MPHSLCSEERGTLLLQLFTAIIFLLSLLCNSAAARGAFSQDQTFVRRIEASAPQGDLSRQKRTVTEFVSIAVQEGNRKSGICSSSFQVCKSLVESEIET